MNSNRVMGVALRVGVVAAPAVGLAIPVVATGCGGHGPGFVVVGTEKPGVASGDSSDAGSDDSGHGDLFASGDALPPGVVFDCKPGTYSGTFNTMVTSDAGGLGALFSYEWTGNLSITLQGAVDNTGAGEIPEPTLTIAPGAKLAGKDSVGGIFNADLSGQLDCPSKTLTATVDNGLYQLLGDAGGGVSMQGTLTATYDGTGSPAKLSMGAMALSSPQIMGLLAAGTWTAVLQ